MTFSPVASWGSEGEALEDAAGADRPGRLDPLIGPGFFRVRE